MGKVAPIAEKHDVRATAAGSVLPSSWWTPFQPHTPAMAPKRLYQILQYVIANQKRICLKVRKAENARYYDHALFADRSYRSGHQARVE
jgi:hypothetical protein